MGSATGETQAAAVSRRLTRSRAAAAARRTGSGDAGAGGAGVTGNRRGGMPARFKWTKMKISRDFGIVIRRAALVDKAIDLSAIYAEFNFSRCFDESDTMVSLGPFFGGDAADACMRSLERLGLAYIEDFFICEQYVPDWCELQAF
ncbi:hypothetical protein [Burkholderia ubonensis]|nr:hypothetical protein [Burkholderia ubonensis]